MAVRAKTLETMRRRLMDPATMTVVGLNSLGHFTLLYTPGWRRKKPMDRFVLTGKGWTVVNPI
jgi:hypothetical protein